MPWRAYPFDNDGDIPNNQRLPLIAYQGALEPVGDVATAFEIMFRRHGWRWTWRNGIFAFHHYHTTAHEVLGVASGSATVVFGGRHGEMIDLEAGDAAVVPAGVGHCLITKSHDLLVIGGYPSSRTVDLRREGEPNSAGLRAAIAGVPLPDMDPIGGSDGPVVTLWPAS